jgi:hypothetical protein
MADDDHLMSAGPTFDLSVGMDGTVQSRTRLPMFDAVRLHPPLAVGRVAVGPLRHRCVDRLPGYLADAYRPGWLGS